MADYVLIFPELSTVWNAVTWLLILIFGYEMTMLDLDGQQNERKHIVKATILFALVIAVEAACLCFNL